MHPEGGGVPSSCGYYPSGEACRVRAHSITPLTGRAAWRCAWSRLREDGEGLALCCVLGLLEAYAPGELTGAGLDTEIVLPLPGALHRSLAHVAGVPVEGWAVEIAARG